MMYLLIIIAVAIIVGIFSLKKYSRRVFYVIMAAVALIGGLSPIPFWNFDGWGGMFLSFFWILLYAVIALISIIYECIHFPKEPINYQIFKRILGSYFVIIGLFAAYNAFYVLRGGILHQAALQFQFSFYGLILLFIFVAYYQAAKQRRSFYILFIIIVSTALPLFVYFVLPSAQNTRFISSKALTASNLNKLAESGNYDDCLKQTTDIVCANSFALAREDISFCLKLDDTEHQGESSRFNCVKNLARKTGLESVCDSFIKSATPEKAEYCKVDAGLK